MQNSKRLLELDVLRGAAALSVVIYHYTTWYNEIFHHSQEVLFYFPKGKYGVELFFLISGFVIFMTLTKVKSGSDFIIGRFSRLYPAYWAAIILTFSIISLAGLPGYERNWHEALINLTMLQSFFNVPSIDMAYWTLIIEFKFYIIMYFLYKASLLKNIKIVSIGWLVMIIAGSVVEKKTGLTIDKNISDLLLLKYANLFIIGMMYYKLYSQKQEFPIATYGIIGTCILAYKLDHSWAETCILGSFILIFELILRNKMKFIRNNFLVFFGTISYSLYLIHQNIGYVIIRAGYYFKINPNTSIFVAMLVSISLASAITFLIEQPLMHFMKEKYKTVRLETSSK
jgi:peptidoglycan/LPS O-acetylase OafA/YrhL